MTYTLAAVKRESNSADTLRRDRQIPAIVYGPDMETEAIAIAYQTFVKLYDEAGDSSLVDVTIAGGVAPVKALIQDVQYDPVTGRVIHVDLRQINMKKEMKAPIEIRFVGEAPTVKGLGGTLVKALTVLNVKCLPQDLAGHIDVDISALKTFADVIRIRDLAIPPGLTVLDSQETAVAKVLAPLTEEQLKAMEEGAGPKSLDEIEMSVEKGKKEDAEEGAEAGAAAEEPKKE